MDCVTCNTMPLQSQRALVNGLNFSSRSGVVAPRSQLMRLLQLLLQLSNALVLFDNGLFQRDLGGTSCKRRMSWLRGATTPERLLKLRPLTKARCDCSGIVLHVTQSITGLCVRLQTPVCIGLLLTLRRHQCFAALSPLPRFRFHVVWMFRPPFCLLLARSRATADGSVRILQRLVVCFCSFDVAVLHVA
eukprot:COSAG02_NODE_3443_length_6730_cov_33.609109_5_plen_190_part_00